MPVKVDDLNDPLLNDVAERTYKVQNDIEHTMTLISKGRGPEAESPERQAQYAERQDALIMTPEESLAGLPDDQQQELSNGLAGAVLGFERIIGSSNDLLSVEFLEAGQLAGRSVGRVSLFGSGIGTAFHVGLGVIMTNNHVFSQPEHAGDYSFELNAEGNRFGLPKREHEFRLLPERFFFTSEELDCTLVAVEGDAPLDEFGWHVLIKQQGKIRKGDPVNIIQHPGGGDKRVVLHNSHFLHIENGTATDPFCWYSSDTDRGSSGSPVFNNQWEVVALHHKAIPKTNKNGEIVDNNGRTMSKTRVEENPEKISWLANEGIRVSRLVASIEGAEFDDAGQAEIRDQLVTLWSAGGAHFRGLTANGAI